MEKIDNSAKNQSLVVDIDRKIEIEVNGESQTWEVVNVGESDISSGKISCSAPLIRCILGREQGEKIQNMVVGNDVVITINKID